MWLSFYHQKSWHFNTGLESTILYSDVGPFLALIKQDSAVKCLSTLCTYIHWSLHVSQQLMAQQQDILDWNMYMIPDIKVSFSLTLWDSKSSCALLHFLRSQQWFSSEDYIFVSYVSKVLSLVTLQLCFCI